MRFLPYSSTEKAVAFLIRSDRSWGNVIKDSANVLKLSGTKSLISESIQSCIHAVASLLHSLDKSYRPVRGFQQYNLSLLHPRMNRITVADIKI